MWTRQMKPKIILAIRKPNRCEFMPKFSHGGLPVVSKKSLLASLTCRAIAFANGASGTIDMAGKAASGAVAAEIQGGSAKTHRREHLGNGSSTKRCRLDDDSNRDQPDEEQYRAGMRQWDGLFDQICADERRHHDQCPIKKREQQNRTDDPANYKSDPRIARAFGNERRHQRGRQFSAGQKSGDRDCYLLQKEREKRADK